MTEIYLHLQHLPTFTTLGGSWRTPSLAAAAAAPGAAAAAAAADGGDDGAAVPRTSVAWLGCADSGAAQMQTNKPT